MRSSFRSFLSWLALLLLGKCHQSFGLLCIVKTQTFVKESLCLFMIYDDGDEIIPLRSHQQQEPTWQW